MSARGLSQLKNSFSLNGILIHNNNNININDYLMQLLGREQYLLSQMVANGM